MADEFDRLTAVSWHDGRYELAGEPVSLRQGVSRIANKAFAAGIDGMMQEYAEDMTIHPDNEWWTPDDEPMNMFWQAVADLIRGMRELRATKCRSTGRGYVQGVGSNA